MVNCSVRRDALRAKGKLAALNQGQFSNLSRRRFAIHSMTLAKAETQLDVNFGRNCWPRGLTVCSNAVWQGGLSGRGAFEDGFRIAA